MMAAPSVPGPISPYGTRSPIGGALVLPVLSALAVSLAVSLALFLVIFLVILGGAVTGCDGGSAPRDAATTGGGGATGTGGVGSGGRSGTGGGPGTGGAIGTGGSTGTGGGAGTGGRMGTGGTPGSGGAAGSGTGGRSGTGGGGGTSGGVEYSACPLTGGIGRIVIYRIDRTALTCTQIGIQEGTAGCSLGLVSGVWCLARAVVSADVAACESRQNPTGPVAATAVTGTFSVTTSGGSGIRVDLDVSLQFPAGGTLPETVQAQVASCNADCAPDCLM
jgi:hypothetical protein